MFFGCCSSEVACRERQFLKAIFNINIMKGRGSQEKSIEEIFFYLYYSQMQIIYTEHINNRLKLRNIDIGLPEKIYKEASERFLDTETGHLIAVMESELYNKKRDAMVAYVEEGEVVRLLTIHPLKEGQKDERIKAGRWRKL